MPAQAGIQGIWLSGMTQGWIPAYAGMTWGDAGSVMPAQAGIQGIWLSGNDAGLDSRLRGNDAGGRGPVVRVKADLVRPV